MCTRVSSVNSFHRYFFTVYHQIHYHDLHRRRKLSTLTSDSTYDSDVELGNFNSSDKYKHSFERLSSIRNVGIFAHVDAGKTTVTERMLALSGVVRSPGSVDDGDTVTDYLPQERERGITIQSAAVGFGWVVPSRTTGGMNKVVNVNLIDTPGHVDFSVEVHRSVAVLDGAVLVVDAVAGVQAQTETVWRAIRNVDSRSINSNTQRYGGGGGTSSHYGSHAHEPLPTLMFVNKMDREGADYRRAMDTVKRKLGGSNPIVLQLPLFRRGSSKTNLDTLDGIEAGGGGDDHGEFVGVLDLVHMRVIVYPDDSEDLSMEDAAPSVINLSSQNHKSSSLLKSALLGRRELVSKLADVDEVMEDLYLNAMMEEDDEEVDGVDISTEEIQSSLRRMTLARKVMPTMCGAALRGVGVEPVLDSVAEYLPCPMDRLPPRLRLVGNNNSALQLLPQSQKKELNTSDIDEDGIISLGHPLHSSTLAYVFKVLHMKGRGGSGDGRVAFARVYSGTLRSRDSVRVISPFNIGSLSDDSEGRSNSSKTLKHPVERIGGMLELSGGQFGNLPEGLCHAGDVCALVGLKKVVTGDTLLSTTGDGVNGDDDGKKKSMKKKKHNDVHMKQYMDGVHLAGLTSPKPVLTLRVEAYSTSEQSRLSTALALLVVEDPSLVVEETTTTTLLSGLGELHMEIVLDRLRREFGLEVRTGKPAVTYRETVLMKDGENIETDGLIEYDRTVGGVRLQGAVQLQLRPNSASGNEMICRPPEDPVVTLSAETRLFFSLDPHPDTDELEQKYPPALRALLSGVRGSMKRGRLGPYPLANLECHIVQVDSELSSTETLPGAMRAASANAVTTMLEKLAKEGRMTILEPKMNVEIWVPTSRVGDVLSDLTGRRGTIDDVTMADECGAGGGDHVKSMVRSEVPLVEILGYANSLRSLTGGEGAFSAEYKGHAPQDGV